MDSDLLILTSPPASGKTYWISTFHQSLEERPILVISPLRALADECKNNWPHSITVMTPEEWENKKNDHEIVIFDEFHLFFYWGDTFRFRMWEAFYQIVSGARLTILLTATLSEEIKSEVLNFRNHFDSIRWINCGNQILKYSPQLYLKAPSKKWLVNQLESEDVNEGVKLIFCQYRQEVYDLEKRLTKSGHTCISCIGGESKLMAKKLITNPNPDFIICTTVLSHGVNLPSIKRVYLLYEIKNMDFWIQMVARGGRKGEAFEVFGLEPPFNLKWKAWKNFILIFYLTILRKVSIHSLRKTMFISK